MNNTTDDVSIGASARLAAHLGGQPAVELKTVGGIGNVELGLGQRLSVVAGLELSEHGSLRTAQHRATDVARASSSRRRRLLCR